MTEQDNTFLNADNLYQEIEGESGKELKLKDDQQRNLTNAYGNARPLSHFRLLSDK